MVRLRIGVIVREHEAHELAGQIAVGLDQAVDVLRRQAARPQVDEAVVGAALGLVAVKIDRRDRDDQVLDASRDGAPRSTVVKTPPSQMPSSVDAVDAVACDR